MRPHDPTIRHESERPTALTLLRLWTLVGLQSFGGGQAVQLYAFDSLVVSRALISAEGWAESWALSQVVPGVNAIALSALTGSRIAGLRGGLASVAGLLMPSMAATVLMAAALGALGGQHLVAAAMRGIVAAAAGGSIVLNWRISQPIFKVSAGEGRGMLAGALAVVVLTAALVLTGQVPVFALLLGGGATTGALLWITSRQRGAATP